MGSHSMSTNMPSRGYAEPGYGEDTPETHREHGFIAQRQRHGQLVAQTHEILTRLEKELVLVLQPEQESDDMKSAELSVSHPVSPVVREMEDMINDVRGLNSRLTRFLSRVDL